MFFSSYLIDRLDTLAKKKSTALEIVSISIVSRESSMTWTNSSLSCAPWVLVQQSTNWSNTWNKRVSNYWPIVWQVDTFALVNELHKQQQQQQQSWHLDHWSLKGYLVLLDLYMCCCQRVSICQMNQHIHLLTNTTNTIHTHSTR